MSEDNGNTRSERLNIRISPDEKEKLRQAADADRRNLSNFIVNAALERADELLKR